MSAWLDPHEIVCSTSSESQQIGIFPHNLFDNEDLVPLFDALVINGAARERDSTTGENPIKPFECVGTTAEATLCIKLAVLRYIKSVPVRSASDIEKLPVCLRHLIGRLGIVIDAEMLTEASSPDAEFMARKYQELSSRVL